MKNPIGFVVSTLSGGGAQRVVANLSLELSSKYQVYIILHDGTAVEYPYAGKIVDLETPVTSNYPGKMFNFFKRIWRLRLLKKKLKMTATISFMENANFINILSGKIGKRVVSVRIYKKKQPKTLRGKLFRLMMKLLYGKSDKVVVPSVGIKQDLINSFSIAEDKIKVIYNPCNVDLIRNNINKEINSRNKDLFTGPTIICAGRLTRQKGQWHFIRSFKTINQALPETKLALLGAGPLEGYLKKLTADLELSDQVMFLGFQDNPFQYFASSSLFVLPSLNEGFPNVIVEAMACGIPVIASDCLTGPREILAPETNFSMQTKTIEYAKYGILTPVCDGNQYTAEQALTDEENMIAEAVINLLTDPEIYKRYKEKSLERILDFKPAHIAAQWIDLIESKK